MKLYFSKGACSLSIRILAHEMGLKLDYESVDLKTKKTASGADYYFINQKGSVPALLLDDGSVLTENIVIAQYLADSTGSDLLPPLGDLTRYRVLEWQSFVASDLHKAFSPIFNPKVPAEMKAGIFLDGLKGKIEILNKALTGKRYLLGDELCLADPYCFVCLSWLEHVGVDLNDFSNVLRYFETMAKRPAVHEALREDRA